MAIEGKQKTKGYKCAAAMTNKFRFVMIDTSADNQVKAPTAATDKAWGVLITKGTTAGDSVTIVVEGFTKVEFGDTVTRGDLLQINGTGGKAKTTVATGYSCARAEESGVSGEVRAIYFFGSHGDAAKA